MAYNRQKGGSDMGRRVVTYPPYVPKEVTLERRVSGQDSWHFRFQPIGLKRTHELLSQPGSVIVLRVGEESNSGRLEVYKSRITLVTHRCSGGIYRHHYHNGVKALDDLFRLLFVQLDSGQRPDPGRDLSRWELLFSRVPEDVLFSHLAFKGDNEVKQRFTIGYKGALRRLRNGSEVYMNLRVGKRAISMQRSSDGQFYFVEVLGTDGHISLDGEADIMERAYSELCKFSGRRKPIYDPSRWGLTPAKSG